MNASSTTVHISKIIVNSILSTIYTKLL